MIKYSLIRNKKYKTTGKKFGKYIELFDENGIKFLMDDGGAVFVKTKKGLRFHDEIMLDY